MRASSCWPQQSGAGCEIIPGQGGGGEGEYFLICAIRGRATRQGKVFWPRCPEQGIQFDLPLPIFVYLYNIHPITPQCQSRKAGMYRGGVRSGEGTLKPNPDFVPTQFEENPRINKSPISYRPQCP